MDYKLREYQQQASDAGVAFFNNKKSPNSVIVIPTGGGKSLVIADITNRLGGKTLILQPNKEILIQNYQKIKSYGIQDVSIFSASLGQKEVSRITLATIGSVYNRKEEFKKFKQVIVDECHFCGPDTRYSALFKRLRCHVLGLTATPYRLCSNLYGSSLKIITQMRGAVFKDIIYQCQVGYLLQKGYLANVRYYDLTKIDLDRVKSNSSGADYDEKSLRIEFQRTSFKEYLVSIVQRVMKPKDGSERNGILVFTRFIEESEYLADMIGRDKVAIVTGETPQKERDEIVRKFKEGKIKVLTNVQVLTCGFDYPELDTIVMARPTKSLALYYQIVGRCIRPYENKTPWFVDISGTKKSFGKVSDLILYRDSGNRYNIFSNGKRLTHVLLS